MINLNTETHYPRSKEAIAEYLAESISIHFGVGKIAVIATRPDDLAKKVETEWKKQHSDSTTLLRFTSQAPSELLDADVTFATLKDFLKVPPICQTLYVTYTIPRQDLYMVTGWMPAGSTVIFYSFKP